MRKSPDEKGEAVPGRTSAPGRGDVAPSLSQWRERALGLVIWTVVGIGAVPLLYLLQTPDYAPLGFRLLSIGLFALTLALALARRLIYPVRTWAFLLVGYAYSGMMLLASGLWGGGRVILLGIPLYAIVFLGPRPGLAAAGMSLALYAVIAVLNTLGWLAPVIPSDRLLRPEFWLIQGTVLLLVLGPVLVLLGQFIGLLRRALLAEKEAAARLEAEAQDRRRLERALLEAAERERRSVGHQLHDGPCQQITAALLRCKVAENALRSRGTDEVGDHIRAIAEMLDGSVGEIHDLARGLSPPELSPGALSAALADLARGVRNAGTVACEFHAPGELFHEDPETSRQILRIAQEAVNNTIRHARARRVDIELRCGGDDLQLLVADDGVGLGDVEGGEGMGLRIMRHRAELLGGTLSIGPAPGGGTLVTCALPARCGKGGTEP